MSAAFGDDLEALRDRLEFIGLDEPTLARVRQASKNIEQHLPVALDRFYERLAKVPAVASFFEGSPQMDRAKSRQLDHWRAICEGRFDGDYLQSSEKVGLRHARIGLEPRWYVGGYALILETLVEGLVGDLVAANMPAKRGFGQRPRPEEDARALASQIGPVISAVLKAVLLDIDVAVSVYFAKLTADAAEQERLSTEKINRAVALTGAALTSLAANDLTNPIAAEFDVEFQKIKDDTNAVVNGLDQIVRQLRGTSRSLKTATSEILSGANDLADRTTRQAATIEETSATMEQLSATVADNAKRAEVASTRARSASELATSGGGAMGRVTEAMDGISSSSAKISSVIALIDDIAFQTNLLALNASVEAARAGEAGKGFAVVAIEVRRLAQNAAQASRDVKELIDQSAGEIRNGNELVAGAASILQRIFEAVHDNETLIAEIAEAGSAQAAAIAQVNVAVAQMDEMTQHNAALVEEINAAIEQTETQATELDMIVDVFTLAGQGAAEVVPLRQNGSRKASR